MAGAVYYPLKLLREQDHDWNIVGNTANSGQTATVAAVVRSDGGGFWMASINNIQFVDATDTLLWRAVRQACKGGATAIVVPRNDVAFSPFPAGVSRASGVTHSDGSLFSDGTGYSQCIIVVITANAAALRATSLDLQLIRCGTLKGGESFSILHPTMGWRIYEISTVAYTDATHATVKFQPPLREAVSASYDIEFDLPRCTMRFADAKAMDLNVTTWPFSLATAKFVESKYG